METAKSGRVLILALGIAGLAVTLVGCVSVKHERSSGQYVKLDYPASPVSNADPNPLLAPWGSVLQGVLVGLAIGAKYLGGFLLFGWVPALLASGSQVPKPSQWSTDPYSMTDYDAVNVMALAMLAAHSTSPAVFDKDVMTVTTPGAGKTVVTSFAAGKAALAAGKQIQ